MPLATVYHGEIARELWVSPEEVAEGATEIPCPDCGASGKVDDQPCGRCKATGLLPVSL